jgi:hypothetical protein
MKGISKQVVGVRVVGTRIMMVYAGMSTSARIRVVLATRVETLGTRAGAFLINYYTTSSSILSAAGGGGPANNFRLVRQVRISIFMISCCVHTTCTCAWCMCTLNF